MYALAIIATILGISIGLPVITHHLYKNAKEKREHEIAKIKYQKEIMELEMEKGKMDIKLLEEENKKLDRIINEN
ncbi:hypothetical protein FACS1894151_04380 [Spirochaetia bacterium]|nr:hypothetical protein FACS1894151_04380 [Spirochaetia bacterium]